MDNRIAITVIGGGPAGLAAALYACRANLEVKIIEAGMPGGKLGKTWQIENYPGVAKIGGAELGMQMYSQTMELGAQFSYGQVVKVKPENGGFTLTMKDGSINESQTVIVATGTQERRLDLPQAEELTGHGISYCAVCDGAFFKDKPVAVIGGGNSALEEALYLAGLCSQVNIIVRRNQFRADPVIQQKLAEKANVKIITSHLPAKLISSEGKVTGLVIKDVTTGQETQLDVAGVFPYIGADPVTDFLEGLNVTNESGYIMVDENMATVIPGLYAAGDVTVKNLRQVVTAVSDGAIAATSAVKYLRQK